ncbi:MAG TPA: AAA family ATPase [Candidatus Paceibacterota bacterium]
MVKPSKPVRIAVSGAHGVGKTTFCGDLAEAFKSDDQERHSVEVVTNVGRDLHAMGIPINKGTEESQYPLFLEKHIANIFKDWQSDFVIYDRTIVDTLAYGIANGNLDHRWISFLRKTAPHLLEIIDVYFYIPIEFEIEDDGVRATEGEYQADVDKALVDILKECRPDAVTLSGGRAERVEQAMEKVIQK